MGWCATRRRFCGLVAVPPQRVRRNDAILRAGPGDGAGDLQVRFYLLSTVSALALSGVASAADLPVKAPPPAPVVLSWTGPYVGAHGGIAWLRASQTITGGTPIATCATAGRPECDLDASGGVFGGQIGYNWQMREWVFGIEADASWTSLK